MAATRRKGLGKKLRFEVFKRDSFKCQYCGNCAPEIVLEIDHIDPVSKGGEDDIMNLITSCRDCNAGKSDRLLSDDSVVAKQRAQLEELNERREQLEMMLQWRDGLKQIDEDSLAKAESAWVASAVGWRPNEKGQNDLRKWLKEFGLIKVLDAIETSARQYLDYDENGAATQASVQMAWSKISGICRVASQPEYMRDLYYARGILRNRLAYCDDRQAMTMMIDAVEAGVSVDAIKDLARTVRTWTEFRNEILNWG
ncbi:HNH endonuclease [Cupriavidus sp. SZY C1]|uniref:HNH endonuclease n=1 Tax=Cupriavidus sp. SZY C1 TaxID=3055037 RepID=UPI0028B3AF07|nr:HNH endonuclease [Cupriavidus sp. SZY C1]MDT6962932.1 HNH endonuclease [Cupriavidus sp. SZY C1]